MMTKSPSVGTNGLNEWPDPTVLKDPEDCWRNSTSSNSFLGEKRVEGFDSKLPDQFRHAKVFFFSAKDPVGNTKPINPAKTEWAKNPLLLIPFNLDRPSSNLSSPESRILHITCNNPKEACC